VENEGRAAEEFKTFELEQNYPNPFNNSTIIGYDINKSSHVSLKIFDLAGREIVALVNDNKPQGFYQVTWNGMNENGKQMASGTYIFTLKTEHLLITKRMILLK